MLQLVSRRFQHYTSPRLALYDEDYIYRDDDKFERGGGEFICDFHLSQEDPLPLYCLLMARLQHEDNDCLDLVDLGIVSTPINVSEKLFEEWGFIVRMSYLWEVDAKCSETTILCRNLQSISFE